MKSLALVKQRQTSKHTLRGKDNWIVRSRRICQAKHFGQTLGRFAQMRSQRSCDPPRDALTDNLHKDMCDEGWEVLLAQYCKSRGGLVFKFAVGSWIGEVGREAVFGYWAQSFSYSVGISDSFQRLERIEVVYQNWHRLGSMCAKEGSEP